MVDISPVIMIVFSATLGFFVGILPNQQIYRGRSHHLQQDWKFRINSLFVILVVVLLAVIIFTEITFRLIHFLGGFLVAGTLSRLISHITWAGKLPNRWTNALQSLYEYKSYQYSREKPHTLGPIIELFDPHATRFSLSNALFFAHLSWIAYRPKNEVESIAAEWNRPIIFIEKDNHVALLISQPTVPILAFRGTDDVKDWQANVNILPHSTPWGNVHSGFLSALEALWPKIREVLSQLHEREQTPWLTGHSLGAAMAVLGSVKLTTEESLELGGIYTFGQPLIANARFVKVYNQQLRNKLFRFETPGDEVTNQPAGYLPVGTLKYLDRHGNLRTDPKFLSKLWDQLRKDSLGLVGEHSILEYLRLIEGASRDERGMAQ